MCWGWVSVLNTFQLSAKNDTYKWLFLYPDVEKQDCFVVLLEANHSECNFSPLKLYLFENLLNGEERRRSHSFLFALLILNEVTKSIKGGS